MTVRVLKARKTLVGDAVEADRIDGVGSCDMPRLPVFSHEERQGISPAGGPLASAISLCSRP